MFEISNVDTFSRNRELQNEIRKYACKFNNFLICFRVLLKPMARIDR